MDKYEMFKNYMHNELGISKEDIRTWIQEAVQQQADKLVNNEFNSFDVHNVVTKIIKEERYFGNKTLKSDIKNILVTQIMEKIQIEFDGSKER